MLELFNSGLVTLWLEMAGGPQLTHSLAHSTEVVGWENTPWLGWTNAPDVIAQATTRQYLATLKSKGLNPDLQGIWLQSGPLLLTSHQGTTPVPAASLTKVATSIVALHRWGPEHRFETRLSATGLIRNGVLQGDLVIQSNGDPTIEWKEAIALGKALNRSGVTRVTGNLVLVGDLMVNYEVDLSKAADLLKQAWSPKTWSPDFEASYQALSPSSPRPQVTIDGAVQFLPASRVRSPKQVLLVRHESPPLRQILKIMNVDSNNAIAQSLTDSIGGAGVVADRAAKLAGVPPNEILLSNGSGLGMENRLSPRAVCALFAALQRLLQSRSLTLADVFPISGIDLGTLEDRKIPTAAVVKTGTLNEVSALAGAVPTRDRGLIWFAIVNRGTEIEDLRRRQDLLLQALVQQWGRVSTAPIALTPTAPVNVETILGDDGRNQIGPIDN